MGIETAFWIQTAVGGFVGVICGLPVLIFALSNGRAAAGLLMVLLCALSGAALGTLLAAPVAIVCVTALAVWSWKTLDEAASPPTNPQSPVLAQVVDAEVVGPGKPWPAARPASYDALKSTVWFQAMWCNLFLALVSWGSLLLLMLSAFAQQQIAAARPPPPPPPPRPVPPDTRQLEHYRESLMRSERAVDELRAKYMAKVTNVSEAERREREASKRAQEAEARQAEKKLLARTLKTRPIGPYRWIAIAPSGGWGLAFGLVGPPELWLTGPDLTPKGMKKSEHSLYSGVIDHRGTLYSLALSGSGNERRYHLRIYDLADAARGILPEKLVPQSSIELEGTVTPPILSPDGERLVYLNQTRQEIWQIDTATKQHTKFPGAVPADAEQIAWHPLGHQLYAASRSGVLAALDSDTGKEAARYRLPPGNVLALAATRSGLVFASNTMSVALLYTSTKQVTHDWHRGPLRSLAMLPDESALVGVRSSQNGRFDVVVLPLGAFPHTQKAPPLTASFTWEHGASGNRIQTAAGGEVVVDPTAVITLPSRWGEE